MKKWQLGWRMMTSVQRTVFITLIVCLVITLVLPETPYLLRMAGAGAIGAWLVVRPRRNRFLHPRRVGGHHLRPHPDPASNVVTDAERASRVRTAAWHNGRRMVEGKTDRAGALQQMRETVLDLPERHETELDDALVRIEGFRRDARDRRARLVAEARDLDVLNAVFAVHYYNRRYSRHVGEYGLGQIDPAGALGDLFTREQIEEAVGRSDALIEEGIRRGAGSRDSESGIAHLHQAHPGFGDRALNDALGWGRVTNR